MAKSRLNVAVATGAAMVAILGGALWLGRHAIESRWRLGEIAGWADSAYLLLAGRRQVPDDLALAADWFVERSGQVRPRLLAELSGDDAHRKAAALSLIACIDAAAGREADPLLFWEAFEDRRVVHAFLDAPPDVLVLAYTPGVHGGGTHTLQWAESDGESTRVWFATVGLSPQLRTMTLRGERRLRFLQSLARWTSMRPLPASLGAPPGSESVLRVDFYVVPPATPGSARLTMRRSFGLSGWYWFDEAITEALSDANRPDDSEAEPHPSEAAAKLLATVLERGPKEAQALARRILDHPLLAETIRTRARELVGVAPVSAPNESGGKAASASPPVSPQE